MRTGSIRALKYSEVVGYCAQKSLGGYPGKLEHVVVEEHSGQALLILFVFRPSAARLPSRQLEHGQEWS